MSGDRTRHRPRTDRRRAWLGGVCAGLGRHFDVDPALVRIVLLVSALCAPGFTAGGYLVAWLLMSRP